MTEEGVSPRLVPGSTCSASGAQPRLLSRRPGVRGAVRAGGGALRVSTTSKRCTPPYGRPAWSCSYRWRSAGTTARRTRSACASSRSRTLTATSCASRRTSVPGGRRPGVGEPAPRQAPGGTIAARRPWFVQPCSFLPSRRSPALPPAPAAAAGRCGEHPWCDTRLSPDARAGLLLRGADARREDLAAGRRRADRRRGAARARTPARATASRASGCRPSTSATARSARARARRPAMPSPMALAADLRPRGSRSRHGAVVGDEAQEEGQRRRLRARREHACARRSTAARSSTSARTRSSRRGSAVGWTKGVQAQGVIANVKHYAVNNQEGRAPRRRARRSARRCQGSPPDGRRAPRRAHAARDLPAAVRGGRQGGRRRLGDVLLQPRSTASTRARTSTCSSEVLKRDWGFNGLRADRLRRRARAPATRSTTGSTSTSGRRSPTRPRARQRRARDAARSSEADGRRARAPHPAHAVRLRLLRPRRATSTTTRRIDQAGARTRAARRDRGGGHRAARERRQPPAARRGAASARSR